MELGEVILRGVQVAVLEDKLQAGGLLQAMEEPLIYL
jgi:hypothetical protein